MKNLPHKNFFGDPLLESYPDDTPSRDHLRSYNYILIKYWRQLTHKGIPKVAAKAVVKKIVENSPKSQFLTLVKTTVK